MKLSDVSCRLFLEYIGVFLIFVWRKKWVFSGLGGSMENVGFI